MCHTLIDRHELYSWTLEHELKTFHATCRVSYFSWNRHTCVPAIVAAIYTHHVISCPGLPPLFVLQATKSWARRPGNEARRKVFTTSISEYWSFEKQVWWLPHRCSDNYERNVMVVTWHSGDFIIQWLSTLIKYAKPLSLRWSQQPFW